MNEGYLEDLQRAWDLRHRMLRAVESEAISGSGIAQFLGKSTSVTNAQIRKAYIERQNGKLSPFEQSIAKGKTDVLVSKFRAKRAIEALHRVEVKIIVKEL
jgi:hypothetical protein